MADETPATPQTPAEQPAPAAPEPPKYLTIEDFNKAASARDKRLESKVEKLFADFATKLGTKPAPAEGADQPEPPAQPAPAQGQQGAQARPADDPLAKEVAKLQKELAAAKRERETEREARATEQAKAQRDEERAMLSRTLTEHGADPKAVRAAVVLLHAEDKRIKRDESGRVVWVDENGDTQDLAAGVKAWLSTDEGRRFVPPRGAQGSGAQPGSRTPPAAPAQTKVQAGRAALATMLKGGLPTS